MPEVEEELAERIRCTYEAFTAGRFDEAGGRFEPDAVLRRADVGPDGGGVVSGREAIVELMRPDAFTDQRLIPLEIIATADPRTVVVRVAASIRGSGSGMLIEEEVYHRVRFSEDGLVVELTVHLERERALAGAGPG